MLNMKKCVGFLCLAACALGVGCAPKHTINADAIDGPLYRVSDRHDAYVQNDESLSDVERSTALRDTELLRKVTDEAMIDSED